VAGSSAEFPVLAGAGSTSYKSIKGLSSNERGFVSFFNTYPYSFRFFRVSYSAVPLILYNLPLYTSCPIPFILSDHKALAAGTVEELPPKKEEVLNLSKSNFPFVYQAL